MTDNRKAVVKKGAKVAKIVIAVVYGAALLWAFYMIYTKQVDPKILIAASKVLFNSI